MDRNVEKIMHQINVNNMQRDEDSSDEEICRKIYTMYRRHCAFDSPRMPMFRKNGFTKANLGIEWIEKEKYDQIFNRGELIVKFRDDKREHHITIFGDFGESNINRRTWIIKVYNKEYIYNNMYEKYWMFHRGFDSTLQVWCTYKNPV